jgi:hypothetical protein
VARQVGSRPCRQVGSCPCKKASTGSNKEVK